MKRKLKINAFRSEMRSVSREKLLKLGFSCSFIETPYKNRDGYAIVYVDGEYKMIPIKLTDKFDSESCVTHRLF